MSDTNDLNAFLAVHELRVDFFQSVWVFKRGNGVQKIHAMLAMVQGGFAVVPFVLHSTILPDTGSHGNSNRTVLQGNRVKKLVTKG